MSLKERDPWLAKLLELAEGEGRFEITVVVDGQVIAGQVASASEYRDLVLATFRARKQNALEQKATEAKVTGDFLHLKGANFPAMGPKVPTPLLWRIDIDRISAYSLARWDANGAHNPAGPPKVTAGVPRRGR